MKTTCFFYVFALFVVGASTLLGGDVPLHTKSTMWVNRFKTPSSATEFFFAKVRKGDYEAAYFVLDNTVQNLLRALLSTMDSSPFAKEGEYVFQQKEISSLVGNDQVHWHSLVFLFDQLMAVGIQQKRFPVAFKKEYTVSGVESLADDSYSIVLLSATGSDLQVLLRKDSRNNWRILGVSDIDELFYWPQPVERMWDKASSE